MSPATWLVLIRIVPFIATIVMAVLYVRAKRQLSQARERLARIEDNLSSRPSAPTGFLEQLAAKPVIKLDRPLTMEMQMALREAGRQLQHPRNPARPQ